MYSLSSHRGKCALLTTVVAAMLFLLAFQTQFLRWDFPVSTSSEEYPVVKYSDIIMSKPLHTNPIVVEEYKLVFFPVPKVGCSEWKLLLRRMMGFTKDVKEIHNPHKNGLKLLRSYPKEKVQEMMTSDEWTRAIFVREPKERTLSAFLNKFADPKNNHYFRRHCCSMLHMSPAHRKECKVKQEAADFGYFLERTLDCENPHWTLQSERVDDKWWPYITFIGYMHTVGSNSKDLLESIRSVKDNVTAWEKFGKSGWGDDSEQGFMQIPSTYHPTNAREKMRKYYTICDEAFVETQLAKDWLSSYLNFDEVHLYDQNETGEFMCA